jgi:ABC-type nitrate/sulfonate/bicarbonate transport system permease component
VTTASLERPPATAFVPASPSRAHGWALHAVTAGALLAWWVYSLFVPAYQIPGPVVVARRMLAFVTEPLLALQLGISLAHVCSAIAFAFVIGAALAFCAHYLPVTRLLIDSRIAPFLNAFSGIGWLFLGILWFGIDNTTVIFAVTMILIPFSTINLRAGLNELDAELIELGASLSRSRARTLGKVIAPMLVPYLFATLRISFGVAWKVTLTAELFGGNAGVGYMLNVARQEFDTETIFAVILFILLFVAGMEVFVFRPLQRRLDRRYRLG